MGRMWAIIEREMRRFRRSPVLIVIVDGDAARAAGRARLRLRRQRQAPEAGDRRSGSRCARRESSRVGGRDRVRRTNHRHAGIHRPGRRADRPPQRQSQRRADDSSGILAPRARAGRAEGGADRGQHRQLRLGGAGGDVERHARVLQPAGEGVAHPGPGDARRRRGLSVRAVHPVPAAGLGRDVDLHDGDDRRRDHLHRRQEPRAARRLSRHADHEVRADCRIQHLRHREGGARRRVSDDHRLGDRGDSRSVQCRCGCSGCSWSSS